jgi:hypothetical protein
MKIVLNLTRDIVPGDVVWFGTQSSYSAPVHPMKGEVIDSDVPEGEWDVNCTGAVLRVKHAQIWAVSGEGL